MSRQQEETTTTLQPTTETQDQQPESVIPPQQLTNVAPVQQSSGVTFAQQPADTPSAQQSENMLPSNNHDQQSTKIGADEKPESPEGEKNQQEDKAENEEDDQQTLKINCPEKIVGFSIFKFILYQFYLTSAAEINYIYTVEI